MVIAGIFEFLFGWVLWVVMPQFGSELRFEPEPPEPNSKFGSRFRALSEPNLKSSSRFSWQ
jgi:hypothetical protein